MSNIEDVGILGFGHALPSAVRTNDDPLFADRPKTDDDSLFHGFRERRVLRAGESVEMLAVEAARAAIADAGVDPAAIDRIYGAVSPSEHLLPSGLFAVHAELGLRRDTSVIPIQSEFTNFAVALTCAWEAIASGRCKLALVVVAAGWSRMVDYADAGAVGIGDAAGAVVVGRGGRWLLVDELSESHGHLRHAMTVELRVPRRSSPEQGEGVRPTFVFEGAASSVYRELVVSVPARLFTTLLARHGLRPEEVALVTHQSTRAALDAWKRELRPGELPIVLDSLGNCTLATVAVTLSLHARRFQSRHVVLMTFGCGQNFSALLLRRSR